MYSPVAVFFHFPQRTSARMYFMDNRAPSPCRPAAVSAYIRVFFPHGLAHNRRRVVWRKRTGRRQNVCLVRRHVARSRGHVDPRP